MTSVSAIEALPLSGEEHAVHDVSLFTWSMVYPLSTFYQLMQLKSKKPFALILNPAFLIRAYPYFCPVFKCNVTFNVSQRACCGKDWSVGEKVFCPTSHYHHHKIWQNWCFFPQRSVCKVLSGAYIFCHDLQEDIYAWAPWHTSYRHSATKAGLAKTNASL